MRKHGVVSFIVSDSWLNADSFSKLRTHLLNNAALDLVAVFDYPVFKVALENSIFVLRKQAEPRAFPVFRFRSPEQVELANTIRPADALTRQMIDPNASEQSQRIVAKMEAGGTPLGSAAVLNRGIHAYRTDGYGQSKFGKGPQTHLDKETESYHATARLDPTYLPELRGKDVPAVSLIPSLEDTSHTAHG